MGKVSNTQFMPFNVLPPHRIPPCLDFAGLAQWAGTCTDTKQKPKRALTVLFTIYDPILEIITP